VGRHVGVGLSMRGFVSTIGMFDWSEVPLELNPAGAFTTTTPERISAGAPTQYVGHYDRLNRGLDPALDPTAGEGSRVPAFRYGVNVALVEVDIAAGRIRVLRSLSWETSG